MWRWCLCSYPYERDLLRYMEQLIRDMDAKIRKNKERADAESRPKVLKLDDQKRVDEMKERQAGVALHGWGAGGFQHADNLDEDQQQTVGG